MLHRVWFYSLVPVISADGLAQHARSIPSAGAWLRPCNLALNNARNPEYGALGIQVLHKHTAYRTPKSPNPPSPCGLSPTVGNRTHREGKPCAHSGHVRSHQTPRSLSLRRPGHFQRNASSEQSGAASYRALRVRGYGSATRIRVRLSLD